MTYVMSDLHGERNRYISMLELIRFSGDDVLYILGDVVDRGPHGVDLLLDIIERPNVHLLLGNHEWMMRGTLGPQNEIGIRGMWMRNGGWLTHQDFLYFTPKEDRERSLNYLQTLSDHLDIEVNGQKCHLVHGLPADNTFERIWNRPEPIPKEPPIPGAITLIGHTPTYSLNIQTGTYNPSEPMKIFYGHGLICVDCGCGQGTELRRLACLRLEDLQEYYV